MHVGRIVACEEDSGFGDVVGWSDAAGGESSGHVFLVVFDRQASVVRITPRASVLTRIPCWPNSADQARVACSSIALLAL